MFQVERLKPTSVEDPFGNIAIVTLEGHGLFEPAVSYLAARRTLNGLSIGSLADEAYLISVWCNFLINRGATWNSAVESDFIAFKDLGDSLAPRRQNRRIWIITSWYYFLATKKVGGRSVEMLCRALTRTPVGSDAIFPEPRYKVRNGAKNKNGPRNTPLDEELDWVLDALATHSDHFISSRNFALGSTVVNTGLRAMGLHSLTIDFLNTMLRSVRIVPQNESITWYTDRKDRRVEVRAALLRRDELEMRPIFGLITEKGGKTRQVQFPSQAILLLLEHIWGPRHEFLKRAFNGKTANALWLSRRSGKQMSLGRIKDILKLNGFNTAKVEGSGHRLRATYLTLKAVDLLRESWENFGIVDSQTILAQLALIAGHAGPSSLEPYLIDAAEILSRLPHYQGVELQLSGKQRIST